MNWQQLMDTILHCKNSLCTNEVRRKIKHENDLMTLLLNDKVVKKLISVWLENAYSVEQHHCKSLEKAKLYRTAGNKEFQAGEYSLSLELYIKSVFYAPSDSEDLPIAIGNRSASLFHLEQYEDCNKDIEVAIRLGYPEKLRYKIDLRKAHCYVKLRKKKLANEILYQLDETISKHDSMTKTMKDDIKKQIAQLMNLASRISIYNDLVNFNTSHKKPVVAFGENPNFSYASGGINKKYTSEKGWHVVANRNLRKGQTLFVEKPFAFVLLNNDSFCEHCCYPYGNVPLACKVCVNTIYCSIKCRDEAWSSYHRWECPGSQICLWEQIGIGHLALKVLLMSATTLDISRFNEVQKLITNFDKWSMADLIAYGTTAALLTLYLANYTDFFKARNISEYLSAKFTDRTYNFDCDIATEESKLLYISSLLLRYILQLIANGHTITNVTTDNHVDCLTEQENSIATAIYPSASIMNHSCDPSISNSFIGEYLIVKAAKDIAANEEVYNCYGPHYKRMPRVLRQEVLQKQYHFTCKCEPCSQESETF